MADQPVPELGNRTPLEYTSTPGMDKLASMGKTGLLDTIPLGFTPGSDVAILTILGYSPAELPSGRGPLEASGIGIGLDNNQTAGRFRLHDPYVTISDIENYFPGYQFIPLTKTSGLFITPPGVEHSSKAIPTSLRDKFEFWSEDKPKQYTPFYLLHPLDNPQGRAVIIGAVPLLHGIAAETGVDWLKPAGATGDGNTDYKSKGYEAIKALDHYDLVILHIEACDCFSHAGNVKGKVSAIENIDRHIILPLLQLLESERKPVAIAVMSDHPTNVISGSHSNNPSPFLYYYPGINPDITTSFSEKEVASGDLKEIHEIYGK